MCWSCEQVLPARLSKPLATYTVQAGDTLWGTRKTGVPLTDLLQINSLRENSILHPGQVLLLSRPASLSIQ